MDTFHEPSAINAGQVLMLGRVLNKNVIVATTGNTPIALNLYAKIEAVLWETSPTTHRGVADACNLVTAATLIAELQQIVIDVKYINVFTQ